MRLPDIEYLRTRISVDVNSGIVRWIDATKHHQILVGKEAGCARKNSSGKFYWHIKIDGYPYKRAAIVYLFKNGRCHENLIDHINGDSLDDRSENLREATQMQNAWNHKKRSRRIELPMGVRNMASGKFQARIACNKKMIHLGTYDTPEQASAAYQTKRKELFGEYA